MAASCAQDAEAATRAAVTALCPSFRARGEPRCTETSMLLGGVLDGRAVIAKYPTDRRPFWLARARHEITVYRALPALAPLPVTVPDMVVADPMHPLIVMTALNGDPVHPHRYLTGTIHSGQLDAVLSLLARVHTWRPAMPSALPYDDDYPSQLAAVRGSEISGIEHSCAVELHTAIRGRLGVEIQHGDAHLGNVIRQPGGRLALIDLEFTAWRWPGYDLAMLWVLLGDVPGVREQLIPQIGCAAERHAAFWCSALLVCLREIASHRRGPQDATRRTRLVRLRRDLSVALDYVQTYHRQIVQLQTHNTTASEAVMRLPLHPISDCYGYDRGTPVDRIYIEAFLRHHRHDIRGHGAELKTDGYLRRFGRDQLRHTTVIDIDPHNPQVQLCADLSHPHSLPTETFDCIVFTQTLQLLADPSAALTNCHQALHPGGALLVTVPCLGRISPSSRSQDRWRFTPAGLWELFSTWDGPVTVTGHGNLRVCLAALLGEAAEDLAPAELDHHDPDFPLVAWAIAHRKDPS